MAEAKISDVARMARVSASTVLNVLDGQTSGVRPEVVQRIKKAIIALDYRPAKRPGKDAKGAKETEKAKPAAEAKKAPAKAPKAKA